MFFFILSLILLAIIINFNNNNHCIYLYENNVLITLGHNAFYEGISNKCIMEGYGKITYADRSYFYGNFISNKKDGYGITIFNSSIYHSLKGNYINDFNHGFFTLIFRDNQKFIFYYMYGNTNYYGSMYYPNNTVTYGKYYFHNNTFIEDLNNILSSKQISIYTH